MGSGSSTAKSRNAGGNRERDGVASHADDSGAEGRDTHAGGASCHAGGRDAAEDMAGAGDGRTLSELMNDDDIGYDDDVDMESLSKRQRKKEMRKRLTEIALKQKNLYEVPQSVFQSRRLEKLDVSWNRLETIDDEVFNTLRELREIDVGFNDLKFIPEAIEDCEKLEVLICRHNRIRFLPGSLHALVSLTELNSSNNELQQFPHEVKDLNQLERLDLSHNEIARVGKTLGTLPALEELCLHENNIPAVPTEIGKLSLLKILRLNNNKITELPPEISECRMLVLLDISSNQLRKLPKELSRCVRLRVLRASDNELTVFGSDFSTLRKLDTLDLSDNKLSVFDANVEKWRRLMILDLSNNDLTYVSSRIGFIDSLKHIGLKGNSKLVIPIHVVVQGTHAIKSYLRTVLRAHDALQKKIEIYNCKVASQPGAVEDFDSLLVNDNEGLTKPFARPSTPDKDELLRSFNRGIGIIGSRAGTDDGEAASRVDVDAGAESRVERRLEFQRSMKLTRKVLEDHDIMYGQSAIRRIQQKMDTGIINLYGCGLESVPPDVSEIMGIRVLDVCENQLTMLDMMDFDYDKMVSLSAGFNSIKKAVTTSCTPLRVLNLSFNQLESVDDSVAAMEELRVLYLSGNRLTGVPQSLEGSMVTDLYIGENRLREFPECICFMRNLRRLAFPCNHVASLPRAVGNLSELIYLDGSFNEIESLPSSFSNISKLAKLDLSFNPLGPVFPDEIGFLENLRDLNLDYTKIVTAPVGIGNLRSIEILRMEGNELKYPFNALYGKNPLNMVKFFRLGLTQLDLSKSRIHELPPTIGRLTDLEELDLSNNSITVLPVELGMCSKLKVLKLDGNPLKSPYRDVCKKPDGYLGIISLLDIYRKDLDFSGCQLASFDGLLERHAEHCLTLDLSHNVLETLPTRFCEFARLTRLNLESNNFSVFPMEVCALDKLEELFLQNNSLEEVPDALFTMLSLRLLVLDNNYIKWLPEKCRSPLRVLTIANNELKGFPARFCEIETLERLILRMNQIETLPQNIGGLRSLEAIDVSVNELKYIPDSIIACSQLHTLMCDNNRLMELPPDISELANLRCLLASNNKLATIPSDITRIASLEQLHLHGNHLPEIPFSLNCQGKEFVHAVTNSIVSKLVEELYDVPFELTVPFSEEAQMVLQGSAAALSLTHMSTMQFSTLGRTVDYVTTPFPACAASDPM